MRKKILFLLIAFIFAITNVNAEDSKKCDYKEIARLKSIVTNVEIYYDYNIVDGRAHFDVTLVNLTGNLYFVDMNSGKTYDKSLFKNGSVEIKDYSVSSVSYKFYSDFGDCVGTYLGIKFVNFPTYNRHYETELCKENKDLSLCNKWVSVDYSYSELERRINDYKTAIYDTDEHEDTEIEYEQSLFDKIVAFYIEYYYVVLGVIILISVVTMLISRKRNSFKL